MCRAFSNILPLQENLYHRHIAQNELCLIFLSAVESLDHLLLCYPWIRPIWFESLSHLHIPLTDSIDVWVWLYDNFTTFLTTPNSRD